MSDPVKDPQRNGYVVKELTLQSCRLRFSPTAPSVCVFYYSARLSNVL